MRKHEKLRVHPTDSALPVARDVTASDGGVGRKLVGLAEADSQPSRQLKGPSTLAEKKTSVSIGGATTITFSHHAINASGQHATNSQNPSTPAFSEASKRRASYYRNNVYVPLGLRKLNAMAGSNKNDPGYDVNGGAETLENDPFADPFGPMSPAAHSGDGVYNRRLSLGSDDSIGRLTEQALNAFSLPPNFGSHVQLFVSNVTTQKSLVVKKKEIYAQLATIFGLILCGFVIFDYVSLLVYERPSLLKGWLLSIQILHVAAFYLSLLSFIYANEAGDLRSLKVALLAFAINLTAFLGRCTFEFQCVDYMVD